MRKHATGSTLIEKSASRLAYIYAANFSRIIMSDLQRLEPLVGCRAGISDYHFEVPKSRQPTALGWGNYLDLAGNSDSDFDTNSPLAVQPGAIGARERHYLSGSSNFATQTGVLRWTQAYPRVEVATDVASSPEIVSESAKDASKTSLVSYPEGRRGQWTCNCRANKDGRCPDNYSNDNLDSAVGTAHGRTMQEAKKAAEKVAKDLLGAKSTHHVQCRCIGPKGERIIPHAK